MLSYRADLQRAVQLAASARARLARGTYGTCTACSQAISLAYLRRRPWTPHCIYCALDI
jgi:RNA polymerase-binding transcription factor DksA